MIIEDIRTHLLSVPFTDPPKTGFLALEKIDLLVVEVETADGVVGTGHLHPLASGMKTLEMCIHEMLKPLLLGEDAADVEALWRKMWQATYHPGAHGHHRDGHVRPRHRPLGRRRPRREQKPLWQLWGGQGAIRCRFTAPAAFAGSAMTA